MFVMIQNSFLFHLAMKYLEITRDKVNNFSKYYKYFAEKYDKINLGCSKL